VTRAFLWVATVFQDVRYGLRMLARSPAIAIVSLALGIGANIAIFTAAKATCSMRLPFRGEERLRDSSTRITLSCIKDKPSSIQWSSGVGDEPAVLLMTYAHTPGVPTSIQLRAK
jgi:hypothetical protein